MIKCEDKYHNGNKLDKDIIDSIFYVVDGVLYFKWRSLDMFKTESAFIRWNKLFSNKPCGSLSGGYLKTKALGRSFLNHRVIYFIETGIQPKTIDHIDGNTLNNKICNLRNLDRSRNGMNCKKSALNTSGRKGVYFHKSIGKYTASITVSKKLKHIGSFETFEEAEKARSEAEMKYYGKYSREQAIKYCMEN